MNLRTAVLPLTVAVMLLAGCAGLPAPNAPLTKLIALELQPGSTTVDTFQRAAWYLELSNSAQPVRLRAGLNYIPVDGAFGSVRLGRFLGRGTADGQTFTLLSHPLTNRIVFSRDGVVVLVPLVLSFQEVKDGTGYHLEPRVSTMAKDKAQAIVDGWRKESTAAAWNEFQIASD